MKRCSTCNQTFTEEWLSFCTNDGTPLLEEEVSRSKPPPTVFASPMPPSVSPAEQATMNLPGSYAPPPIVYPPPAQVRPAWQPPPPPNYVRQPSKSLATASMVTGIIGATVGWMCVGPIPGIAAIILGAVALSQIKKSPESVGGTQFAWIGIATGGLTLLIYVGIMLFYVVFAILAAGTH